jgi:hypothetical protein
MEPMTAVMRHLRSAHRAWPPQAWWPRALALVALAVAVALGAAWVEPTPATVPAVVVDNPGGRSVNVVVRAADRRDAPTLALGQVGAGGRGVFHDVLDLGDEWMVMLSYGPVSAGELRVDRGELEAGWAVPDAVATHFDRRAEAATTPPAPVPAGSAGPAGSGGSGGG